MKVFHVFPDEAIHGDYYEAIVVANSASELQKHLVHVDEKNNFLGAPGTLYFQEIDPDLKTGIGYPEFGFCDYQGTIHIVECNLDTHGVLAVGYREE